MPIHFIGASINSGARIIRIHTGNWGFLYIVVTSK
jgi:hypothetical protein